MQGLVQPPWKERGLTLLDQKLVSVVIPTYNHAEFLRLALQSVMDQSYPHWEAIVVDNHSEDHTDEVLRSFSDSRIRVIKIHNNGVIAASRNRGIAAANGKYVAFLDSDDTWYPEKLTTCIAAFQGEIGLVSHGLRWIGARQREMYPGPESRATFDALIDHGNCITPSATIVLKSHLDAVGGFSEIPVLATSEDYHLWIKLARLGVKTCFLRQILGEYRIHAGNQSSAVDRHLRSVLGVVDEFLPPIEDGNREQTLRRRRRYSLAYYGAGRTLQYGKHYRDSLPYFFRAIKAWPFAVRNYAAGLIGIIGSLRFPR